MIDLKLNTRWEILHEKLTHAATNVDASNLIFNSLIL